MNIYSLVNFLFVPFGGIIKIIIEHYHNSALIELEKYKINAEREERQRDRIHQQTLKDKDNDIRKFEAEEKTKRLNLLLEKEKQLSQQKLYRENVDPIKTLIGIRKNKKGRKTK